MGCQMGCFEFVPFRIVWADSATSSKRPMLADGRLANDNGGDEGAMVSPWVPRPPHRANTVSAGRLNSADPETKLVVVSDPGQDLDDEMAFILMRLLVEEGLLDLRGIVATLAPAYDRARLCRGTLDLLGLQRVPVGVGSDGGDLAGKHTAAPFEAGAHSYLPGVNSEQAMNLEPGTRLLHHLYEVASSKSLSILCIASLKDVALFMRDNEAMFRRKTKEVVIMGGVEVPPDGGALPAGSYLIPDTAHNQEFDKAASAFVFRRCQELGVRLVVVSRWAAYPVKMPRGTYDQLALSGSSIGRRLRNAQRESIEALWARACAPAGDARRGGLPNRCDRAWFISTFCNGRDDPDRTGDQTVWDLVEGFVQYDSVALLCAIPSLRSKFFEPVQVSTRSMDGVIVDNLVIGVRQSEPNMIAKHDLLELLQSGYGQGLAMNHHFKIQVILLINIGPSTLSDLLLTMAMLRTLYQLRTLHCLGIIATVSLDLATPVGGAGVDASIETIRATLDRVGMRFVPLHHAADNDEAASLLRDLYNEALPTGVTIVATAPLTAVAKFIEENQKDFSSKTARVVIGGGVLPRSSAEDLQGLPLQPDPEASNNALDMDAATKVYRLTQELSVPMLVLSRFAATLGRVPKRFFTELENHGGPVGKQLAEVQRQCIRQLWVSCCQPPSANDRMPLPSRCDRHWFLQTFCAGRPAQEVEASEDIWDAVSSFNVYSPMCLLAAVPTAQEHFMLATRVKVRAATHLVVGWSSADNVCVRHPEELQNALAHGFIYGARCNESEFAIPQTKDDDGTLFDMSEVKLMRMFPLSSRPSYVSAI
mmetsp:Transcript_30125/g.70256  ORF Transcript_30125/g.70256 Transcript_30125/m.70256 type:complete len:819 (+) Transcript_30125:71-2527(+)